MVDDQSHETGRRVLVVELFLPLDFGDGKPVPADRVETVVAELTARFGGATAFTRSPADGLWTNRGEVSHDRIVIVEVMIEEIDVNWWTAYRARLEKEFQQQELLIRATRCQRL